MFCANGVASRQPCRVTELKKFAPTFIVMKFWLRKFCSSVFLIIGMKNLKLRMKVNHSVKLDSMYVGTM